MKFLVGLIEAITGTGLIRQVTEPLVEAHKARLEARNDAERLDAEREIARLEQARDVVTADLADRWSAVRAGRWLIVVPWGLWWAAIYLIQIANPWLFEPAFGFTLVVHDVPEDIKRIANILIPAIVIGDATMLTARRFQR